MVYYCFVNGCKSTTYRRKNTSTAECVTWHALPTSAAIQEKWAHALGVQVIPKSSRICSKHFPQHCFERCGLAKRRLKPNSVPTLQLHSESKESLEGYSGALQEITITNTHNTDEKENYKVTFEPPDKLSERNSITSSPQFTPERSDRAEITPTNPGIKEEENSEAAAVPETPESRTVSKIRYPGDISEEKVAKMSPSTIVNSMRILKEACAIKDRRIKRLQRAQRGQKRKIEKLQQLLSDLRKIRR